MSDNFLLQNILAQFPARPRLAIKRSRGEVQSSRKYPLMPLFNAGKHSTYVQLNLNNYMYDYDKVNTLHGGNWLCVEDRGASQGTRQKCGV